MMEKIDFFTTIKKMTDYFDPIDMFKVDDHMADRLIVPSDKTEVSILNCPKLKTIVLHKNVAMISIYNCPSVELIDVSNSDKLDSIYIHYCDGIKVIKANRCKKLSVVHYYGDAAIDINMCPSLLRLAVSCSSLRVRNCVGLDNVCTNARELTVVDCPRLGLVCTMGPVDKLDLYRAGKIFYPKKPCREIINFNTIEIVQIGSIRHTDKSKFIQLVRLK
jgi:hypothetical protein